SPRRRRGGARGPVSRRPRSFFPQPQLGEPKRERAPRDFEALGHGCDVTAALGPAAFQLLARDLLRMADALAILHPAVERRTRDPECRRSDSDLEVVLPQRGKDVVVRERGGGTARLAGLGAAAPRRLE